MSEQPHIQHHLGIPFWNAECRELLVQLQEQGGLLVVPSGPNLTDCRHDSAYKGALKGADVAVMDSGYLALILKLTAHGRAGGDRKGKNGATRISGLQVLEVLLNHPQGVSGSLASEDSMLWVVPNQGEQTRIESYLANQGFNLANQHFYQAPFYNPEKGEGIADPELLQRIQDLNPRWIILCIAGGKQEKLGFWLRQKLEGSCQEQADAESPLSSSKSKSLPAILCTGAAIAFFTGGQAKIPKWADRLYLGWLCRIFQNPKLYTFRYLQAARLPFVLKAWRS